MLKKERLKIIREWYPNAITTIDSINRIISYFEDDLEIEPSLVMMADSICSDDVNSIQFPSRASEFLGPFKMGGLNGYPFAGLTGMSALSSHVPDDGAVFLFYGPHIGITKAGVIGEINRFGQTKDSGCCGAASAAVKHLIKGEIIPGKYDDMDYQMSTIEQIVLSHADEILQAPYPIYQTTEAIYDAIDERINELIERTHFSCKYILLMGVILINSDTDMGSFTMAKRCDLININTKVRTDLMTMLCSR